MKTLKHLLWLCRSTVSKHRVRPSIKAKGSLRLLLAYILVFTALLPSSTLAASVSLVIGEVLYDPIGTEPDNEWIELYNLGEDMLNLSDFKVGDEETFGGGEGMMQFPSGTIAPGEAIVVANRAAAFFSVYGFNPDFEFIDSDSTVPDMMKYTTWSGGNVLLVNTSEETLILGANDNLVDAVSWGSSTFAFDPGAPDVTAGHSLAREFANIDTDTAGDWLDQEMPNPNAVETSANPVPIPAALWLFASGLLGLVGLARRRLDTNRR